MSICKNCGAECPEQALFCTNCGTAISGETNHAPQENPVVPTYQEPTYNYSPAAAESGNKVQPILGMIFGITAAFFAFILLVSVIEIIDSFSYSYYGYYSITSELMGAVFGFSVFIVPSFIVGLIMSFKAKTSLGMAIAGKITAFIAIGLFALSFFIALAT